MTDYFIKEKVGRALLVGASLFFLMYIIMLSGVDVGAYTFKKIYALTGKSDGGRLSFWGKRTMPIYFHSFFFVTFGFVGFTNVVLGVFSGIGASLLIYYLVKRYRLVRILLFGEF